MPQIEFKMNGTNIYHNLPSYAFDPAIYFWAPFCKGTLNIYPLVIPGSVNIEAFCIRHADESLAVINPYVSDAFHGAVVDVAISKLIKDEEEQLEQIEYKLLLDSESVVKSHDSFTIPERPLKAFKSLSRVSADQTGSRPIIFTEDVLTQIEGFALSEPSDTERMAAIETELYWDPDLQIPWIFAHNLIPFANAESNEAFVQVHGGEGPNGLIHTVGRSVSLFHTHLMSEENHKKCFFSETDKATLRKHLAKNQFSLVGNIVPEKLDMGCAFHLYTFDGSARIFRDSFYICKI